jgi:hypothetical protein
MEQAAGTLVHGTAALAISSASTGAATTAAKDDLSCPECSGGIPKPTTVSSEAITE